MVVVARNVRRRGETTVVGVFVSDRICVSRARVAGVERAGRSGLVVMRFVNMGQRQPQRREGEGRTERSKRTCMSHDSHEAGRVARDATAGPALPRSP